MQAKSSATELFFGNKRHKFVKKKSYQVQSNPGNSNPL